MPRHYRRPTNLHYPGHTADRIWSAAIRTGYWRSQRGLHLWAASSSRSARAPAARANISGGSMRAVHKGLGISNRDFDALVQDLGTSLNKFKVPAREQKELVVLLAPMRKDIIER